MFHERRTYSVDLDLSIIHKKFNTHYELCELKMLALRLPIESN